jgi:hypothetical protein
MVVLVLVAATAHVPVHAPQPIMYSVEFNMCTAVLPSLTFFTHLLSLQSNASELQAHRVHASVRGPTSQGQRINVPPKLHCTTMKHTSQSYMLPMTTIRFLQTVERTNSSKQLQHK